MLCWLAKFAINYHLSNISIFTIKANKFCKRYNLQATLYYIPPRKKCFYLILKKCDMAIIPHSDEFWNIANILASLALLIFSFRKNCHISLIMGTYPYNNLRESSVIGFVNPEVQFFTCKIFKRHNSSLF